MLQLVYAALHLKPGGAEIFREYNKAGRYSSGGKSCPLAVGGLPVQSHPGRVPEQDA